ncbi:reactive oxygen species modulator 1 isoform X3 [Macaca thibetana thibetana]|uniref:reactive oxygen species modulator 1 isoform X3 n=1 Tax=Macaca thibetana thibetana TaxID=257877 RepID=UPI0021BC61E3|nr:reactive oxygen species modulator 1 isoform X3 [Macaca thibetana thibetana]
MRRSSRPGSASSSRKHTPNFFSENSSVSITSEDSNGLRSAGPGGRDVELSDRGRELGEMPVAVGPYGQSQPSCFDRVKMGFVMGCAVGMAAGALFGTFSCLRIGMRGRELMGGIGKTMMQSGGTFGTFMAIGMGIRC